MDYNPTPGCDCQAHTTRDVRQPPEPDRLRVLDLEVSDIDVLLDGSMFTTGAIDETLRLVRNETSTGIDCYVSAKFVDTLEYYLENSRGEQADALSFYEAYDEFETIEPVYEAINSTRSIRMFDLAAEFGPSIIEKYNDEYRALVQGLNEPYQDNQAYQPFLSGGSRLGDTLFEELVFGIENSPIASRLKKVYRQFASAVGPVFEIPEDNIAELYSALAEAGKLSEEEFRQVLDKIEGTAERAHLKALNEIERVRQQFKTYSPNWVGTPMKYAVPVLIGVALGSAGLLSGVAAQAASIVGELLAYNGCVWLADP